MVFSVSLTAKLSDFHFSSISNQMKLHSVLKVLVPFDSIFVYSSVRAIVALNLHNYASGRNPWGNLKPEYLEKVMY